MRKIRRAPLLLALSLAAACGDEATTPPTPPRDATPPVLEILAPTAADSVVFGRSVQVRARCREDAPGGCTVEVLLQGRVVAQGADSVDAAVSVAEHVDRSVRFVFVASNAGGGKTTAESGELRITSSRWIQVQVGENLIGRVLDTTPERVIYLTGEVVTMRELATGAEQRVYSARNAYGVIWRLFPGGVLATFPQVPISRTDPTGIKEIGGSDFWAGPGYGERVTGRWVTWVDFGGGIHRDDVLAPRLTTTPVQPGTLGRYDVAPGDGTLVYEADTRSDRDGDPRVSKQIYRAREAAGERITSDTAADALDPKTDGTLVAYTRVTSSGGGFQYQLMLLTPAGEVALTAPHTSDHPVGSPFRYEVRAGWVVFTQPDAAEISHVWTRSPAGQVRRMTPWATSTFLVAMGPSGQTVVLNGDRWYFARTPDAALVDIGVERRGYQFRWFHGDDDTYLWSGGLLRLDIL